MPVSGPPPARIIGCRTSQKGTASHCDRLKRNRAITHHPRAIMRERALHHRGPIICIVTTMGATRPAPHRGGCTPLRGNTPLRHSRTHSRTALSSGAHTFFSWFSSESWLSASASSRRSLISSTSFNSTTLRSVAKHKFTHRATSRQHSGYSQDHRHSHLSSSSLSSSTCAFSSSICFSRISIFCSSEAISSSVLAWISAFSSS